MSQRILVILGHPSGDSLCGALARRYADTVREAGHQVRIIEAGALNFDPVLHAAYQAPQTLEPDLLDTQQAILWAEHLVWVFPVWWGSVPAVLKGLLDRILQPGFGFKYQGNSPWPQRLLAGRTADLVVTMDAPPWYFRWVERMPAIRQMCKNTLAYCGIKPLGLLTFGPVLNATPARREDWLNQVVRLAGKRPASLTGQQHGGRDIDHQRQHRGVEGIGQHAMDQRSPPH